MARINFDDNVESQDEFWALLPLVNSDRDKALGMLVRFFRIAQWHYGRQLPIPLDVFKEKDLELMIQSKWAVPVEGGFQVKGAEKHFSWYEQRVSSSAAGGRARSAASRDDKGRLLPNRPAGTQPEPSRNPAASSPLAPAPVPALALVQKNKEEKMKTEIAESVSIWEATLKHTGNERKINLAELTLLGRLVQGHTAEVANMALIGARHEPAFEGYDPRKNVNLMRLEDRKTFQKFVNLGCQKKQATAPAKRDIFLEEPCRPDSEAKKNALEAMAKLGLRMGNQNA